MGAAVQDVTVEDNTINGAPAGDQAIAIANNPRGTTALSSPRLRVWQWPGGPFGMTGEETEEAESMILTVARPELRDIQAVWFNASAASRWLRIIPGHRGRIALHENLLTGRDATENGDGFICMRLGMVDHACCNMYHP